MTGQIPFVLERNATGSTAEIFADIKATQGVATVNLIWRHLAVVPAQLARAWAAARPIYASEDVSLYLDHFAARLPVVSVPAWRAEQLDAALPARGDIAALAATFATYNLGNAQNLLTLSALLATPAPFEPDGAGSAARLLPRPAHVLPTVPELDELSPAAVAKVLELNRLGADGAPADIVATLYKHLAYWPGMLDLTLATLAPAARDGTLLQAVRETREVTHTTAAGLAGLGGQLGDDEAGTGARAAIQMFTEHLICRLLPVGLTLRAALGHLAG